MGPPGLELGKDGAIVNCGTLSHAVVGHNPNTSHYLKQD